MLVWMQFWNDRRECISWGGKEKKCEFLNCSSCEWYFYHLCQSAVGIFGEHRMCVLQAELSNFSQNRVCKVCWVEPYLVMECLVLGKCDISAVKLVCGDDLVCCFCCWPFLPFTTRKRIWQLRKQWLSLKKAWKISWPKCGTCSKTDTKDKYRSLDWHQILSRLFFPPLKLIFTYLMKLNCYIGGSRQTYPCLYFIVFSSFQHTELHYCKFEFFSVLGSR